MVKFMLQFSGQILDIILNYFHRHCKSNIPHSVLSSSWVKLEDKSILCGRYILFAVAMEVVQNYVSHVSQNVFVSAFLSTWNHKGAINSV